MVSTHSRLKAAGGVINDTSRRQIVSTHSRLKAAGIVLFAGEKIGLWFQHTAA